MDYFTDLNEFWNLSNETLMKLEFLSIEVKENIIQNKKLENITKVLNKIEKENVDTITIYDENYPPSLRYIDDKPLVIFKKGQDLDESNLNIGIVGSRKATAYGKWACEKFTKELVNMGVTIVSGLAQGIDTIAHRTALENNGKTIGVLGCGIDIVYPKKNLNLFNEMEKNASILSEFPIGTDPIAFNLPQRNRIISGLSLGVVVIEAQEKSGSLITAHHALDQGKDVFALPGNINSIFSGGTNKLIKDGAKPLLTIDDIIEEIYELRALNREIKVAKIDYDSLSETEASIVKLLGQGPIHSDLIAYNLNIDISTINSSLTILELKGIIGELQARVFALK